MKHLLLSAGLLLLCAGSLGAQCVVVADKTTGAWGVGYNNDGLPTSYKECAEIAAQKCNDKGGLHCKPLYQGTEQGWWAAISGVKDNGDVVIALVAGKESESEAETSVRQQYDANGGMNAQEVAAFGWYVRNNLK